MNVIAKLVIERIVRQALTAIGGVLVVSPEDQTKLIGAVSMLVAFGWSIVKAVREKNAQARIDGAALARAASKVGVVAFCLVPLLGAIGCVRTTLKNPNGVSVSRTALGLNTAVGSFSLTSETNGASKLILEGYQSEGVQAIEAVARGVASGLNPSPIK